MWPKYWSFSISLSNGYSGLISFRIDWFDLLAVQGTLKSRLQHHSLKTSILQSSAFFIVQLTHLYMAIGTTIALTIWTFVSKVMCLFFDTLCMKSSPSLITLGPAIRNQHGRGGRRAWEGGQDCSTWRSGRGLQAQRRACSVRQSRAGLEEEEGMATGHEALGAECYTPSH